MTNKFENLSYTITLNPADLATIVGSTLGSYYVNEKHTATLAIDMHLRGMHTHMISTLVKNFMSGELLDNGDRRFELRMGDALFLSDMLEHYKNYAKDNLMCVQFLTSSRDVNGVMEKWREVSEYYDLLQDKLRIKRDLEEAEN